MMFSVDFNNDANEPFWIGFCCPFEALEFAASVRSRVVFNGKTIWSAEDV